MILHVAQLLDQADLDALREVAARVDFADGRATAGSAAEAVKRNEQAQPDQVVGALRLVEQRLEASEVFLQAARPSGYPRFLLSRYGAGMGYGAHVDEALIAGRRTDLSFTLFLSTPGAYDGGELVMEDSTGERGWKLPAGDLLLYPSTYVHRVNEVRQGERLAVVGWVTSRVRDPEQRELLFELETAVRTEWRERGDSDQLARLNRVRNNLLRRWVDA
jgi:PKHD-type hydroxylase